MKDKGCQGGGAKCGRRSRGCGRVHVTAVPSALDPLRNWTVPVGPAPLLFVATFAVSVTLPPELMVWACNHCSRGRRLGYRDVIDHRYRDWL